MFKEALIVKEVRDVPSFSPFFFCIYSFPPSSAVVTFVGIEKE